MRRGWAWRAVRDGPRLRIARKTGVERPPQGHSTALLCLTTEVVPVALHFGVRCSAVVCRAFALVVFVSVVSDGTDQWRRGVKRHHLSLRPTTEVFGPPKGPATRPSPRSPNTGLSKHSLSSCTCALKQSLARVLLDKGGGGSCSRATRTTAAGLQRLPNDIMSPPSTGTHHRIRTSPWVRASATWCVQRSGQPQRCIRRERTSEAAPEAVRQAVGGGCQSGWGRFLSVTNATQAATWRQSDSGWP